MAEFKLVGTTVEPVVVRTKEGSDTAKVYRKHHAKNDMYAVVRIENYDETSMPMLAAAIDAANQMLTAPPENAEPAPEAPPKP